MAGFEVFTEVRRQLRSAYIKGNLRVDYLRFSCGSIRAALRQHSRQEYKTEAYWFHHHGFTADSASMPFAPTPSRSATNDRASMPVSNDRSISSTLR
jgi:hypothetical protein